MVVQSRRSGTPQFRVNKRDTISLLSVIGLTLLALLAGLLLREAVEARTRSYSAPGGVAVQYPDSWRLDATQAENGTVRVLDPTAPGAPTELALSSVAVDPQANAEAVLGSVASNLTIDRGRTMEAFKQLDIRSGEPLGGQPTLRNRYVFVNTTGGVFADNMPHVMLGEDRLVRKGGKVYIFSMHAAEENYERTRDQFDRFVQSATLP
ncbi:MAG: hypothetical protein M3P51_00845 [Chloroflexota bacterium]|nr:hypothetical protein [Chloroflexota bacterium]